MTMARFQNLQLRFADDQFFIIGFVLQRYRKFGFRPFFTDKEKSYYFFDFGKGYQNLEKKDRLCFKNIPAPKNCIDKNLIFVIYPIRKGGVQFRFNDAVYIQETNGRISQAKNH